MNLTRLITMIVLLCTCNGLWAQSLLLSEKETIELVNKIKRLEVKAKQFDHLKPLTDELLEFSQTTLDNYDELYIRYKDLLLKFNEAEAEQKRREKFDRIRDIAILLITALGVFSNFL